MGTSPLVAACLFFWVVLGAVRYVHTRQWGKFAIAVLGATAVFGYQLAPHLVAALTSYTFSPTHTGDRHIFFAIPSLWRHVVGPFQLIRFVAGLLCIGAASVYFILPLFTKRTPDVAAFGYLFVLLALIALGFQRGWSPQYSYDPLAPITPFLRFVLALFLLWLAAATIGAFLVVSDRPSALGRFLRALGGLVLSLYELLSSRRRMAGAGSPSPALTRNGVYAMSSQDPEDLGLPVPSLHGHDSAVAKNPIKHSLWKRERRREREGIEEIAKTTEEVTRAVRATRELEEEKNKTALERGRGAHVRPRLESEESDLQATLAENQARKAEAESRRAAALRSAEASSQPRPSPADELTKRMEKIIRRFEQLNKQGTDKEALAAWVKSSWGAEIDLLRARGDEVGAQRLEQQLQQNLDDIATGEA